MLARSAAYDDEVRAVRGMQKRVARLEIVATDGTVVYVLDIVNGTVSWSRQSGAIMCQLDVEAIDRTDALGVDESTTIASAVYGEDGDTYAGMDGRYGVYNQTIQTGVLMPYGSEVRAYAGYRVNGADELTLLGTFQLRDLQWDGGRRIKLTTYDRAILLQDHIYGFVPVSVAAGQAYETAMDTVFQSGLNSFWRPRIARSIAATGEITPKLDFGTSPGGNRWNDVSSMARVCRMYARMTRTGNLEIAPASDPATTTPAWTIADGPDGTLVSCARKILKSQSFNGVIVTGSNATINDPVRGEARDEIPESPTYWDGPAGYKPRTISTPLVTNSAMAQNLANAVYVDQLGMHEEVEVTFLPHYALELTDTVFVDHGELGINYPYRIDRLSFPLGVAGMASATLKRRKSTDDY